MKKQILFLAIFTLAFIFAGTTKSYGQLLPSEFGTAPIPLTSCIGTAQEPKAGIPYTYLLDETGTNATATDFQFWATKDQNFISGNPTVTNEVDSLRRTVAGELLDYSANYLGGGTTPSVDITWSAEILANTVYQSDVAGEPTFVVGWATDGCTDNIKVWEIDPTPSFTVDITVINDDDMLPLPYGDATAEQCVDVVRAAIYNPSTDGVDYHYGYDTLYYEVVAANFVTSWVPTFFLTGLDGGGIQEASIGWASSMANAQAGTFIESGDISGGSLTGSTAITADPGVLDNSVGLSVYVQVIINNNNYETLAASTIGLSVAGEDAEGFDIDDDATCTQPANAADAADDDVTTRTLSPRPTLIEGTPTILPNTGIGTP
ncbi:hypothetical protein [uncultured Draconibacterium sp.]|uniref:hypothetical protein n=1 Tax=uncultured Draconibacterium sp. TaxID=1573823 RepID=UPI003260F6D5